MLWCLQVEWIVEHAWFDAMVIGLISNWIKRESPLWFEEIGISLDEQWNSCELRDDSLFWQSVSVVFSLSVYPLFLIWDASIYWQFNNIWFGIFSQHLLRVNYEFNLVFHLIRAFHMSLFFWHCHMAFFIWCCHVT